MLVTGSPDISVLQLQTTWDISGLLPVINIQNLSQGTNLAGLTWWFVVTSPSGTPIHEGTFAAPDITGAWSTFAITDPWPRPFNQIEFSGAPYNLTIYIQDSVGNQYSDNSYSASIQRPNGNVSTSKNFYGVAATNVKVLCRQARIYFEDISNTSYYGNAGTRTSSSLRVIYPIDPTYSIPPAFVASFSSPLLVPISYSAKGYQFLAYSIYTYQLSTYVFVVIKYQNLQSFDVLCNIDLMPLVCEITKLIDSIDNGTCNDVQDATRKLILINPKFALVVMGIMQPLTGVDVAALIDSIIEIGGFTCDCCNASTGIIPNTASVIDGYTFSVNPVCGDVTGTVTVSGTNIQFNLQDKAYVFNLNAAIPTTAFTITPAVAGCVNTYTMNVNMVQFGTDLANTILSNASLANLWNTIFNTSNNTQLVVDGKCIFQSSATYNYTFTLAGIPTNTTFAIITGIQKGAATIGLNFNLNLTNLVAFQTYLNTLGLGTFTVTNPSGNTVLVTSNANVNVLSQLTYSISSTNFIANFTSAASGFAPLSANQVVQNIINYLCALDDSQVVTSQPYTITYIDENGDEQILVVPAGTTLSDFINELLTLNARTITNISQVLAVTCENLTSIFGTNNLAITANDFVYATKGGGACSKVGYLDIFNYMLTVGPTNATIKNLFCQFVAACAQGLTCAPYSFLEVLVTPHNTVCSEIVGIEFILT